MSNTINYRLYDEKVDITTFKYVNELLGKFKVTKELRDFLYKQGIYLFTDCQKQVYTQVPLNRLDYGVVIDMLSEKLDIDSLNEEQLKATDEMYQELDRRKYKDMDELVKDRVELYTANGWSVDEDSARNHYLREAKCVVIMTSNLYQIESILNTTKHSRTPVTIFNPFMLPHTLNLRGPYDLTEYYDTRKAGCTEYYYGKSFTEHRAQIKTILDGMKTPWLNGVPSMKAMYQKVFNEDLDAMMEYIRDITGAILAEGQWDVEACATHVQREAMRIYTGKTLMGYKVPEYNQYFKVFHNYDVLPYDELNLFMQLTYYKAVGIQPMVVVGYDKAKGEYRPMLPDELEPETDCYDGDDKYTTTPMYCERHTVNNPVGKQALPYRNKCNK